MPGPIGTNRVTASKARALMRSCINTEHVQRLRHHVDERIKSACMQGKSSIAHPLHGLPAVQQMNVTPETLEALWNSLKEDGFAVDHHADPDPGHPASGPYTTVEW